jgi:hypothetical protein
MAEEIIRPDLLNLLEGKRFLTLRKTNPQIFEYIKNA